MIPRYTLASLLHLRRILPPDILSGSNPLVNTAAGCWAFKYYMLCMPGLMYLNPGATPLASGQVVVLKIENPITFEVKTRVILSRSRYVKRNASFRVQQDLACNILFPRRAAVGRWQQSYCRPRSRRRGRWGTHGQTPRDEPKGPRRASMSTLYSSS